MSERWSRFWRDTNELRDIWIGHDTGQWTAEAFRAIAEILAERNVPIPEPGGAGAKQVRAARAEAIQQQHRETKVRFTRDICYFFGFLLALPVAVVALFLVLELVVVVLQVPNVFGVRTLFLCSFADTWYFSGSVLSRLLIKKFVKQ